MDYNRCRLCCRHHSLRFCPAFLVMVPAERYESARAHNYCLNCLATSHRTNACTSQSGCRRCGRAHHTLLHRPTTTRTALNDPQRVPTQARSGQQRGSTPSSTRRDSTRTLNRRVIQRPTVRVERSQRELRQLQNLVNQAKGTLEELKELLYLSAPQAGRHVEDMSANLIEFED